MRLFLAVCMTVLSVVTALAQSTTFYDKQGNRQGTITQEGSQSVERDKHGDRTGSFSNEGGHTVYRDAKGNRTGSAVTK